MDTDQINTPTVVCGNTNSRRTREGDPTELALCASHAELPAGQHLPAA